MIRSLEPDVIALQKLVEGAGKLFNTVTSARDLAALVTAADDVIVLYEGLLADTAHARELLEQGSGVFVQPVEAGLAAGFERIDINNASAGMLRIPGRLIDSLMQLPPDCDVPSALTRIALQAGISLREVPPEARSGLRWQLIASDSDAYSIEQEWIAHRLGHARAVSPGRWLARLCVLAFGSSLLHAGNASLIMAVGMLVALALAVATNWLGSAAGAFIFCAAAWVFLCAAAMLTRLEAPAMQEADADGGAMQITVLDWLFDGVLILLIHTAAPPLAGTSPILSLALPVALLLLVRLCGQLPGMPGAAAVSDRTVLSLLLSFFAALGLIEWMVASAVVALSAICLAVTRPRIG